ncbi:MAG: phenylalanine--tRNA ligase subunit beta [Acidilobaceae archaeon]
MPVVRVKRWRLEELTGFAPRELEELLFRLKCELEVREDYAYIEVNSDRPDMLIGEGIARAVKGLLGERRGWRLPETARSRVSLRASSVPSRPYVACAVIKNVDIDSEDFLEELIQFQEKLHDGLGRRRRKAAIGLHDLSKLPSESVEYTLVSLGSRFKPLGGSGELTVEEVLESTEKGRAYGGIALYGGAHPALVSGGEIIAIPPVLNSEVTRVEVGTRHLFVDVTGTDERLVETILDIIASTLSERRGAVVELVEVKRGESSRVYPVFRSKRLTVASSFFTQTLGVELSPGEVVDGLERMLHNASASGEEVVVDVAPFRVDVLKPVDLAEDLAISLGYDRIAEGSRSHRVYTVGSLLEETRLARRVRELMVGYGFVEVSRLMLTSPRLLEALKVAEVALRVSNPVQLEYSVLRPTLAASLLDVLREEQHKEKPLKLFELGPVASRLKRPAEEDIRLGAAILDYSVGYEDIQAVVYSLLRLLGVSFTTEPSRIPFLIEGRQALLRAGGTAIGWLGEVRPDILEATGIEYPTAIAEISLDALLETLRRALSTP